MQGIFMLQAIVTPVEHRCVTHLYFQKRLGQGFNWAHDS